MADLKSTVQFKLKTERIRARVWEAGGALVVSGPHPARICSLFANLPGVSWLAAGYEARGLRGLAQASAVLAERYLRSGGRFSVEAEAGPGGSSADISGVVTSRVLDAVPGARVSVRAPAVAFRAALDGVSGVAGVELSRGPGGTPTGERSATCLVSGGKHSSVLAWHSVLMGFRVTLVHAETGRGSVVAAAQLYSELSHRADPRGLKLVVLESGSAAGSLRKFLQRPPGTVFGGFTAAGGGVPNWLEGALLFPLYLLPEEAFESEFRSLALRGQESIMDWGGTDATGYVSRAFGGVTADVSDVIDQLD